MKNEGFDNLGPATKIKLLKESAKSLPDYYRVLTLFHNQKLCIECGRQTQIGSRQMIAVDGEWPTKYLNLWRCVECLEKVSANKDGP